MLGFFTREANAFIAYLTGYGASSLFVGPRTYCDEGGDVCAARDREKHVWVLPMVWLLEGWSGVVTPFRTLQLPFG